jgi:hypothetical protein
MVITEFEAGDPEATLHAMAAEILEYRRAVRLLAKGDRLSRRWRAIRADRSRSLLASERPARGDASWEIFRRLKKFQKFSVHRARWSVTERKLVEK